MTDWAKIAAAVMLGAGGCVALVMEESDIAAACFGFLGGWLLKNGVVYAKGSNATYEGTERG